MASAADEEQDNQLVERLVEMGYNEEQAVGCGIYEGKSVESAIDFIGLIIPRMTPVAVIATVESQDGKILVAGSSEVPVSRNNESDASDDNVGQFEADLAAALSASLAEATLNSTATTLRHTSPPPPPPSAGAASTETQWILLSYHRQRGTRCR